MKIYCIKNPFTFKIVYIGKTKNELYVRLLQHFHEAFHKKREYGYIKQKWFEKYAINGVFPIIELLEETAIDLADVREKFWIQKYNPILNTTFANNEKLLENISNVKSIKIYQYNKQGEFIKEWKSITEAATTLNIEGGNISGAAIGKRKLAGVWMWSYYKLDSLTPYKRNIFKKEVHKYDINGNYICSYDCARSVPDVKYKLISKCCTGSLKSIHGFRYSFEKKEYLPKIQRKIRKDKGISRYSPNLIEI